MRKRQEIGRGMRLSVNQKTGGAYSVKKYKSKKEYDSDESWHHAEIILEPLNPAFELIDLSQYPKGEVRIIAEFICVLK